MDIIRSVTSCIKKYVCGVSDFTFNVYDYWQIQIFSRYILNNPDIITTQCDYVSQQCVFVDGYIIELTDRCINKLNTVTKFNDTKLKLKGYFMWKTYYPSLMINGLDACAILYVNYQRIYPIVTITKCNNNKITNKQTYIQELSTANISNTISVAHLNGHMDRHVIEKSYEQSTDILHDEYMDTYFSSSTDTIMNKINNLTGLETVRFIFHGPSGTGKSSFIHRLTILHKSSVMYVDVSKYDLEKLYRNIKNYTDVSHTTICVFTHIDKLLKEPKTNNTNRITIEEFVKALSTPLFQRSFITIILVEDYEEILTVYPNFTNMVNATPIKFNYMDHYNLQKLSLHHFGKQLDISDSVQLNIPMSCIMNKLLDSKLCCNNNEDSMDYFKNGILELADQSNKLI